MASRQFRRSETHPQHHRGHRYRYCQPLFSPKPLDPMGQPAGMAKIPSTSCRLRFVLGATALRIPTPRVALMVNISACLVKLRHRHCCQPHCPPGTPDFAPMPSYPRPNSARQHGIPWQPKTGARRILPPHRCPRGPLCQMPHR